MVSQTKSRKIPTRRILPLFFASQARLAEQSLDHWMGFAGASSDGQALHGFSYTAGSPMNVMLGRKHVAYTNITHLLSQYITPNTMYYEGKACVRKSGGTKAARG